jgi:hypothetical protein
LAPVVSLVGRGFSQEVEQDDFEEDGSGAEKDPQVEEA